MDPQEIKVTGNHLVEKVREIIKEGQATRRTIKKGDHVYMEIPMSVGLGGAMAAIWLAPAIAAVGAIAALVADVELVIQRDDTVDVIVIHEEPESAEVK